MMFSVMVPQKQEAGVVVNSSNLYITASYIYSQLAICEYQWPVECPMQKISYNYILISYNRRVSSNGRKRLAT